jgi:hypothetical protein
VPAGENDLSEVLESIFSTIEEEKSRLLGVVVHMNDTYLLDERRERGFPGFPRVISTIKHLREHVKQVMGEDRTLVLHSGDFLGPSLVGKNTKGLAMVELLNRMGLDWCVLGNHEFDYGEKGLNNCLNMAKFGVVMANIETPDPRIKKTVLWPSEKNPIIAITGIVSETVHRGFPESWKFLDPKKTLTKFAKSTKKSPFHIVLTHAGREEDRQMRKGLARKYFLLGGHDHDIDWGEHDWPAVIYKNKSNLETVRVILLFAGSASSWFELYNASENLAAQRFSNAKPAVRKEIFRSTNYDHLVKFPNDAEKILSKISKVDAAVFRNAWQNFDREQLNIPCKMMDALFILPRIEDHREKLLRCEDHTHPSSQSDEDYIREQTKMEIDATVVKDATDIAPDGVDVSDLLLRHYPAPIGTFAAECIRKKAQADIAILNAGSFRVDGILPSKITVHDLKECFLYDSATCIIVLPLPRDAVEAMISHGRKQLGLGGYPQTAPSEIPPKDELLVAITSYLLESDYSLDEYDKVLSEYYGIETAELRAKVTELAKERFSIISAIVSFAEATDLQKITESDEQLSVIEKFIKMADALYIAAPNLKAKYMLSLKDDYPIPDNPDLEMARNSLRAWLRTLADNAEEIRKQLPRRNVELIAQEKYRPAPFYSKITATLDDQPTYEMFYDLYSALNEHVATFKNNRNYASVLEHAATDIGDWVGP